jgi:hypothetical protein
MTNNIAPASGHGIATAAELDEYIANLPATAGDGRLIFGLDATGSRQSTWDTAARIQTDMFKAVHGLSIKLIYFRGDHECKASSWVSSPQRLGDMMRKITCLTGETQIGRVLDHARREKISALVYVGDCVEEEPEELYTKARALRAPAFMFQEGEDEEAERVFRQIAKITKGAFAKFEPGAAAELAKLLRAVAAYAVGGMAALDADQVRLIGRNRDGL